MSEIIPALIAVLNPVTMAYLVAGVALGIIFGAIPGLTATLAIALLIPFTFGLDPVNSLVMLTGIYSGSMYGNSITAITIRTPGNPAAAVTVLDGYPLAQQGKAGWAIGMALVASAIGGIFSVILMSFLSPALAQVAIKFSPAEYFAVGVFGLTSVVAVSGKSLLRGVVTTSLGLLLGTVGIDRILPFSRFTFDKPLLLAGVPFLPALIGVFAVAEVFRLAAKPDPDYVKLDRLGRILPSWQDIRSVLKEIMRGSVIGSVIGILPGAGGTMASFVAYGETRRASKHPERFGKGAVDGMASAEAANNAVTGGAMIPMLTLGIPGDAVTAVLLGALVIQGLQPGPLLFTNHASVVYPVFVGMFLGNIVMLLMGLATVRLVSTIALIPNYYLVPLVATFSFVGAFAESGFMYHVWLAVIFGVAGYLMEKYGFPVAPMILGMILSPIIEGSLRQSLIMSQGAWSIFVTRPISLGILVLALLITVSILFRDFRRRRPDYGDADLTT